MRKCALSVFVAFPVKNYKVKPQSLYTGIAEHSDHRFEIFALLSAGTEKPHSNNRQFSRDGKPVKIACLHLTEKHFFPARALRLRKMDSPQKIALHSVRIRTYSGGGLHHCANASERHLPALFTKEIHNVIPVF